MIQWYIVHTQTGFEEKVKAQIEYRAKLCSLDGLIPQILIPTEQVSEVRAGKKRISERKFFPGYILIEMELNEKTWHLVRKTPGVTGFIGPKTKPIPLRQEEVENIIKQTEIAKEKPSPKVIFEIGESVKIVNGPFVNFNGTIDEVFPDKGKLKVSVSIFGRPTPVELEYWQVEKI
jgi:transcriptional antiterminator NusG